MAITYPDVWEAIADAVPDAPAVIQGTRTVSWASYDDRSSRIAGALSDAGLGHDSKVGVFLFNSPEYLETQFASFKIRATPINVNYRYLDDELWYLLDNADCEALVFHSSLSDRVGRVIERLPDIKLLIEVPDDNQHLEGAHLYEDVLAAFPPAQRIERRESDVYMLYTGGTTGMPKGVMYEIGAFTRFLLGRISEGMGREPFTEATEVGQAIAAVHRAGMDSKVIPCCPLMHGTGMWLGAMLGHLAGGSIVLMESRSLDVDELWQAVEHHGVTRAVIVGDAFARPMLRALDDRATSGSPYDTSSLRELISSGAMLSTEVKDRLITHIPELSIIDILGSTEGSMGRNVTTAANQTDTARFELNDDTRVFDEDDRPVEPGSGIVGIVGTRTTNPPLGYFKDSGKSAKTFRKIGDVHYTFPGDMATVEADGTIMLLGRGSNCINTGGEKVFPEEVEEAVKTHELVDDCLIFGVDDDRFGQRVIGVVSICDRASVSAEELIAHTKARLSPFKAPRQLVIIDEVPRAPNGKADYTPARNLAESG